MQCRHCKAPWEWDWEYCPECRRNFGGAIYPLTQTPQEIADIERIVAEVADAFRDVQLEDGETIHEADLEGAYSDDSVRLAAREKDPEVNWRDIPDWKLDGLHPHGFFDLKGWRFHIPAYMIWTLRNWRTSTSVSIDYTIWEFRPSLGTRDLQRYSSLSFPQGCAVYDFLHFFCTYSDAPEPREAIEAYWHGFAPSER